MAGKLQMAKKLIDDQSMAEEVEKSVKLTYGLIKTNNLYVKTFFKYFEYREQPTEKNKLLLTKTVEELKAMMAEFLQMPGCVYRLDGMEQLVLNVNQALENLPNAEKLLANAPNEEEIQKIISDLQQKYVEIFDNYKKEAIKLLHWEARVDGSDLMKVKGDQLQIEHLRYDPIVEMTYKFENPLPAKEITVIPVDIQSRSYGPFVLEQPTEKNNFTATIYLSDFPFHGYSWWKLDLYYIQEKPETLGIVAPWQN
jgi:hypothetical protein